MNHTPALAPTETLAGFAALLRDHGLATVGGAAYGMSPYLRLSFASAIDTIDEGCRRIAHACARLR